MEFKLTKEGFITKFLYTGKKESEFIDEHRDTNQLRYEKYLRSKVSKDKSVYINSEVKIGEISDLGLKWKYYDSNGNIFLEDSNFYPELKKIDLYAYTELVVEEDMCTEMKVWSYSSVDIWVNDELIGGIEKPVYKPIQQVKLKLNLKKGKNKVLVRLVTLGVRDTRISFALQILENFDKISVTLPNIELLKDHIETEEILKSGILNNGYVEFEKELPNNSFIIYLTGIVDFKKYDQREIKEEISNQRKIKLKDYPNFRVEVKIDDSILYKRFEQIELQKPEYLDCDINEHHEILYKKIGEISSITRDPKNGFAVYPMLSRYYQGMRLKSDIDEFMTTLKQIQRRRDCSDFMTCGLIRFIKEYEISEEMESEMKATMLNYRYWMDENGQDGMCFWSENHSLMFFQTAYFFGLRYPEEIFVRSGKKGSELSKLAKTRLLEWFEDVTELEFDEFNSGVYSPITFSAMLNIVDYAEEDLSELATKACDILINRMAIHTFKGAVFSPQGRTYRDILYPYKQSLQSVVNFVDKNAPYIYSEWLISLATSKYTIPENIKALMFEEGEYTYNSSNSVIDLYKTKDYILTSVQSPRRDGLKRVWERELNEEKSSSFSYTKTINESFHGTTQFEPGVFGYQQHLWYATLDTDLSVFINHPGQSSDSIMVERPGYWSGNGIIPALRQEKGILASIYNIPKTYPIQFTHLFWNTIKFDTVEKNNKWLFGKKENSYIAIWSLNELIEHDDVLFNCEKRSYGNTHAFVTICGSKNENESFELFKNKCLGTSVEFTDNTLFIEKEEFLKFITCNNSSQYVE